MKKIIENQKGLTLIEAIVGMAIFVTVVTLAVGGFINIVRLQRKSLIMRETQQNARIALGIMTKDARQAEEVEVLGGGSSLKLEMPGGTEIVYYVSGGRWVRKVVSNETEITAPGIIIDNPTFSKEGKIIMIRFKAQHSGTPDVFGVDETILETTVVLEGEE